MEFSVRGSEIGGYTLFFWEGEGKKRKVGFVHKGSKIAKFKDVRSAEDVGNRVMVGKMDSYNLLLQ